MTKSINQIAQDMGDTSAREAQRIRAREIAVRAAWRHISYEHGSVTAEQIAYTTDLPVDYVRSICERSGYQLHAILK